MATEGGFVYVLSNECMPGCYKVGATTVDVKKRARELFTTGVPSPFSVEFAVWCVDPFQAEKRAHAELSEFRVDGREFFRCELRHIVHIVVDGATYRFNLLTAGVGNVISDRDAERIESIAEIDFGCVAGLVDHVDVSAWRDAVPRYRRHLSRFIPSLKTEV